MIRTIEMDLEFQETIPGPPASPKALFKQACSSDEVTMDTWRDIWVRQTKANHEKFGPFKERGIGKYHNHLKLKPAIIVGSGPSLKNNVDALKDTKGIPIISCLHNYHLLEDKGIKPEFYVTLDAGPVTIEEVAEGGTKSSEEYFESTKDKKLLAFIGTHPELLKKWKGEIVFYNCPIPDQGIVSKIDEIENFSTYVGTGGNVLGACFYAAKAIMGANPIIFVGADFSFSYTKKFHGWDSKYDVSMGETIRATDVYGNRVYTWPSYYNFKCWFESRVCSVPGMYINATEGGIFGSYHNGNIAQVKQMTLSDVIHMYSLSEEMRGICENPEIIERKVLF